MRDTKLALYLHLVWGTWDRLPLITSEIERHLHRNLVNEVQRQECSLLAIGGTEDHIHLLVSLPSTLSIAQLVKQLKGVSSHFVNNELTRETPFKWQGAYGAFTVSRWDTDRILNYIQHQKEHHTHNTLMPELELLDDNSSLHLAHTITVSSKEITLPKSNAPSAQADGRRHARSRDFNRRA
ncbi:MAG: IS200/IS605 family transposase [Abitibacteriaceae bacterium]|nr:IS200/IS605 family transposase [Abditibacteriaceae bacterium]MBV9863757.1 IS200/IS605 family transposase [Abditibacteriaceae bacterium]